MRNKLLSVLAVVLIALSASAESYVGASGVLALSQGGSDLRRMGGGELRVGTYVSDNWAVEASTGVQDDFAALGVGLLGHWTSWSLYDRFFGFSAFDPFVTVGAKGWMGHDAGQVGPSAGLGAFYHLDDHWSLRADATTTLGLETRCEMLYTLALGLQYAF